MFETPRSRRGMTTAPHPLAAEAGLSVLRDGGNAVEAMVAMLATIAVVYPHMTGLGGDAFWLIAAPGAEPIGIDACGRAAAAATGEAYRAAGAEMPTRGPRAALTVAGAVSGWEAALRAAAAWDDAPLPLSRLLEDAILHAREGWACTASQSRHTGAKLAELRDLPGFADLHLDQGAAPAAGTLRRNPALAALLEALADDGLDGFYRGAVAELLAADLAAAGSPLALADLAAHRAEVVAPLSTALPVGRAWNLPPPTQGFASLMILGQFWRLDAPIADSFAHVHGLVEATKRAFLLRDAGLGDPARFPGDPRELLTAERLAFEASEIEPGRAAPWPAARDAGDTVWMGCCDAEGRMVSCIQSIYWEFGSGVALPRTGIVWQNRGAAFSLDPASPNRLEPGAKPRHTLNPAYAELKDGRRIVYGAMGGDGQPQFQAAVFSRVARYGQEPQAAVTAPRWLLGRTWGDASVTLKLERRWPERLVDQLRTAGHAVELVPDFTDLMGHAGLIALRADGVLEGAADPRGDGQVGCW